MNRLFDLAEVWLLPIMENVGLSFADVGRGAARGQQQQQEELVVQFGFNNRWRLLEFCNEEIFLNVYSLIWHFQFDIIMVIIGQNLFLLQLWRVIELRFLK